MIVTPHRLVVQFAGTPANRSHSRENLLESYTCRGRVAQLGEHLLCKQAEIHSKLLLWLRFRVSDPAKCVPKMFLPWRCRPGRSEEHTSELQSPYDLVCR